MARTAKTKSDSSESGRLKIEYAETASLIPCPANPRKNDENVDRLIKSMAAFGWTNPILVRRENNMVIAGHTRLKAAVKAGLKNVPVVYLDLSDADAKTYMLADNKLTERAEWDGLKLAEIFAELDQANVDLDLTGFESDAIEEFVAGPSSMPADLEMQEVDVRPYRKTHILLSFEPEKLADIKPHLEAILAIDGIEYEQASNG